MNNEMLDLYNALKTELEVIKALTNERWKNHDDLSVQRWGANTEKLTTIQNTINAMFKRVDEVRGIKNEVTVHRFLIISVILLGIVLGVWLKT